MFLVHPTLVQLKMMVEKSKEERRRKWATSSGAKGHQAGYFWDRVARHRLVFLHLIISHIRFNALTGSAEMLPLAISMLMQLILFL